jgi:hypothetical protein
VLLDRFKHALNQPIFIGRRPKGQSEPSFVGPDWVQASPERIDEALNHALAKPDGGWFCVDASAKIGASPTTYLINGETLVLWRSEDQVYAAPETCPHMGASLACAPVEHDTLTCPWHGLKLGPKGHGTWRHLKAYDDGVLTWVQFRKKGTRRTDTPLLPKRPAQFIDAVIRMEAVCEPEDIIANRLDPWHGCHFHPYSFAQLTVLDATLDVLTLRVAFRIAGPLLIEVDATFHAPDPRTIVMTIIGGDGLGSVVETHATPMGPGRTAMIEATLATSERRGFHRVLPLARLVRPYMKRSARRLWVDDVDYAERRYAQRTK